MRKVIGVIGIGLLLILIAWMPSVVSEQETNDISTKLYAFGFIRINSHKYEINGFVFAGLNGNQVLILERIQIDYDGTPIRVTHPVPFLFIINYNPA